ncbi:hypothetical protein [Arthrobacter crystallopoietes]|uniref:hypothetical protein n=1 Tax=Crystallibacter crystallopoietes TaxID=37928 RepID=UPI000943B31C|nr:hypothetical protein [Arthrobacter crystallopoietes]AUI51876.1 hypothetical protein AC20117_14840 [Arthrobacter crystallopoietes]
MKRIVAAVVAAALGLLTLVATPAHAEAAGAHSGCLPNTNGYIWGGTCTGTLDGLASPEQVHTIRLTAPAPGTMLEVLKLPNLHTLYVYDVDNSDIAEAGVGVNGVAGLLNTFYMSGSGITDLTPLSAVNRDRHTVRDLGLYDTKVHDFSPLGVIPNLYRLNVTTHRDGVLELLRGKPTMVEAPIWLDGKPLHPHPYDGFLEYDDENPGLYPVQATATRLGPGLVTWVPFRAHPAAMGDVMITRLIKQDAIARDAVDLSDGRGPFLFHSDPQMGGFAVLSSLTYTPIAVQWTRDGAVIPGATEMLYTYTTADIGRRLAARVTIGGTAAEQPYYPQRTLTIQVPGPIQGVFKAPEPVATGKAAVGNTLTANPGAVSPAPAKTTYRWYSNGQPIAGATAKTYKLTARDYGKRIHVAIRHERPGYMAIGRASDSVRVGAGTLALKKAPVISGTKAVGKTLRVSTGTWSPAPQKYTYQWFRDGKRIAHVKGTRYTLQARDRGKKITVKVTVSLTGYTTRTATTRSR